MINEKSAGAIIFRMHEKEFMYLLLYKRARMHYRESWDFPKGNTEESESEEGTAKREAMEESGLKDMHFIGKFRQTVSFFYRKENQTIHKTITFFLAQTNQEEVTLSYEHSGYKWCSYEEALTLLTHKNSKEILKKANEFLKAYLKQKRLV